MRARLLLWLPLVLSLACQDYTNPGPVIDSIDPDTVFHQVPTPATISGQHFYAGVQDSIDSDDPPVLNTTFEVVLGDLTLTPAEITFVDTETIDITTPRDLPLGTHDLSITTPDGRSATLEDALTVVACESDDPDCDNFDDDCDGSTDEDYVPTQTTCGTGVCAATGQLECQDGSEVDTCTAGSPTEDPEATCDDSLDNDCDGDTDGADSDCAVCDPPWWDPAYLYRRRLTITENASGPLPQGYSVAIRGLDTQADVLAGKMLVGGDDLRIAWNNGITWQELDRRVVGMNTGATTVWFKTQTAIDQAGGNYFLYYGNPAAANPPAYWSDSMGIDAPSRVYLAADDFQEHSQNDCPDGWSPCNTDWWVEENGAERYLTSDANGRYIMAGDANWTDIRVDARVRSPDPDGCPGIASRVEDVSNLVYAGYNCEDPPMPLENLAVWTRTDGSYLPLIWGGVSIGPEWHTVSVAWTGSDVRLYHDGTYIDTGTAPGTVAPTGTVGLFSTYATNMYADDLVVRLFVDPEPTVSAGPEEPPCP